MSQASNSVQRTTINLLLATSAPSLPPFRSSTEFPKTPSRAQLTTLYADCFRALQDANAARNILKGRMQAKKRVIAAIRLEINRLEGDLSLEAGTRAQLHALNLKLVKALQEMDTVARDLDRIVHEAHRVPRTRLGRLIESLKATIREWRAFLYRQQQELADTEGSQQNGGLP